MCLTARPAARPDALMPASPTTRLAVHLTRLAWPLAAQRDLDIETLVPGAMMMLTTAVADLEHAPSER